MLERLGSGLIWQMPKKQLKKVYTFVKITEQKSQLHMNKTQYFTIVFLIYF